MIRLLALLAALTLGGCARKPPPEPPPAPTAEATPDLSAECCSQCRAAASKDPSGMDLSLVECGEYAGYVVNQKAVLEPRCAAWFAQNSRMVQDCR